MARSEDSGATEVAEVSSAVAQTLTFLTAQIGLASEARSTTRELRSRKGRNEAPHVSDQGLILQPFERDIFLFAMRSRFCLNGALVLYAGSSAALEAPEADQYETPGPVNAQDFLPKSAFSGKKIFVEKIC